ncbi:MAG: alkaline phosphatase family protein [Blastocatellia bacterium]|nr:alkaline phosphatase family protein [Blastocatellia bacterium]
MKILPERQFLGAWLPAYFLVCCSILPLQSFVDGGPARRASAVRRLVIVLDGVPYQTIADLRAEGRFRRFRNPAQMVSTFPSLTNPAMIEILHETESVGYEDHYYDRDRNRLLGTIQDRLQGGRFIQGTFRETFDYHAPAFKGALGYVAAPMGAMMLAQVDLSAFRAAFRRSEQPFFVAYIGETDSLAHLGGEQPLKSFLRTLDRTVDELIAEAERNGGQLEVEMFSDHGNRYDEYRHVKLNDALQAAGFVAEKSVTSAQSVVLPKHGLVGASMLFTQPGSRARVAEVCAATEGVDFAAWPASDDLLELVSSRGRARILRAGDRYRYEDASGDPLALGGIVQDLHARGRMDAGGFASSDDWWQATRNHLYADPLRRLFDGFHRHIKNRADVIVSYRDGYLVGSPLLSIFAHMRATHGNLLRGESIGFAISTRQDLPAVIRGFELNHFFTLDRRARAGGVQGYFSGGGHCQIGPALAQSLVSPSLARESFKSQCDARKQ